MPKPSTARAVTDQADTAETSRVVATRAPTKVSLAEYRVIIAGVEAANVALAHYRRFGVTILFNQAAAAPLIERRLEALRAYAELRCVLRANGRDLDGSSLLAVGFISPQIDLFDALIASISCDSILERMSAPMNQGLLR
jgi:hypothetical protein